jgi:23S rRNA (adenine2503-C2)-methyltransferase
MPDTALMPIPGQIDPVPVARDITPRADGRVDLIGPAAAAHRRAVRESRARREAGQLRAKQVFHWLYHRGVTEFEAMTDIAKTMRPWLTTRFVIGRPEVIEAQHSSDGTRKWLLRTADSHDFEMGFIPDADRGTLCVSSQVGCHAQLRFCHTGTMRLVRNLTPGEIVGQVMLARDALGEWPKGAMDMPDEEERRRIHRRRAPADQHRDDGHGRAAVQLRQRPRRAQAGDGRRRLASRARRITLSTSGVVPMMAAPARRSGSTWRSRSTRPTRKCATRSSRSTASTASRSCSRPAPPYPGASNARRITFEYVMLDGKNDSDDDARELVPADQAV